MSIIKEEKIQCGICKKESYSVCQNCCSQKFLAYKSLFGVSFNEMLEKTFIFEEKQGISCEEVVQIIFSKFKKRFNPFEIYQELYYCFSDFFVYSISNFCGLDKSKKFPLKLKVRIYFLFNKNKYIVT